MNDQPRRIPIHTSLTQRPLAWGVGMEVIVLDAVALYVAWLVGGGAPLIIGALLLACALTWAVRRWRKEDAFGVESYTLGLLDPSHYEAQPRVLDAARKPKPSIPPRPVK